MRAWFGLVAGGVVCAAVALAGRPAWADPVTVTVSTMASGSFDGQDFTNRLVTLQAHFSTEDYLNCATAFSRGDYCDIDAYLPDGGETARSRGWERRREAVRRALRGLRSIRGTSR